MKYDIETLAITTTAIFLMAIVFIVIEERYENLRSEYKQYKALEQEEKEIRKANKVLDELSASRSEKSFNALSELSDFEPCYN